MNGHDDNALGWMAKAVDARKSELREENARLSFLNEAAVLLWKSLASRREWSPLRDVEVDSLIPLVFQE